MLTYKEETINNALMLLNKLPIVGIDNAKRIAMIAQLLETPEKGDNDGSQDKEV